MKRIIELLGLGVSILLLMTASAFAAKGYNCVFPSGKVHTFENDVFQEDNASQLAFKIGNIQLERQTATLITANGQGGLKIVRAIGANHFLEVITEGFLNITTIYGAAASDGSFPAVHSRHFGLLGTPVVSQYHGTCKAM